MAENENNEVEVVTHEGPTTNGMLDNMIAGKASEVQDNFNDLMHNRATEALDDRKVELAKDIFRQTIEGKDGADVDEFDKMGLTPDAPIVGDSLDDALVDINMDTGIPVDKEEETNENT
tara:strand:+ start:423 stop:779 length:357 start_codon:yes stop_codon:yes gene_type:complete